jgi:hypothetical protein
LGYLIQALRKTQHQRHMKIYTGWPEHVICVLRSEPSLSAKSCRSCQELIIIAGRRGLFEPVESGCLPPRFHRRVPQARQLEADTKTCERSRNANDVFRPGLDCYLCNGEGQKACVAGLGPFSQKVPHSSCAGVTRIYLSLLD